MRARFILALPALALMVGSCSAGQARPSSSCADQSGELLRFARANCFVSYFHKMNYDTDDIGHISGGIVETGSYGIETYERVVVAVREYQPKLETKHDIDVDLLKCFAMDTDKAFIAGLDRLATLD